MKFRYSRWDGTQKLRLDADKVFILQDYTTLFLFEVASGSWTTLALPGGGPRAPFVRVSRSNG